jgi:hypothetical protein
VPVGRVPQGVPDAVYALLAQDHYEAGLIVLPTYSRASGHRGAGGCRLSPREGAFVLEECAGLSGRVGAADGGSPALARPGCPRRRGGE